MERAGASASPFSCGDLKRESLSVSLCFGNCLSVGTKEKSDIRLAEKRGDSLC